MPYDCIVVDDEQMLADSIAEYFSLLGIKTRAFYTAAECRAFLETSPPRLLLLDINLPGESGLAFCQELRQSGTDIPILFLSARTSDDDKLSAFGIGGDDFIEKPCSLSVLFAKVQALLRRLSPGGAPDALYDDGMLRIDQQAMQVTLGESPVPLTPTEFRILVCLARSPGSAVSKAEIFDTVWPDTAAGDGTLNVHIRHLREQIEEDPSHPRYIVTVHGTGYRFVPRS